jgi:integrase
MGSSNEFGFRRVTMGELSKYFETPTQLNPFVRIRGELPVGFVEITFQDMDLTPPTRDQYIRNIQRFVEWVEHEGWSQDVLVRYKNYLRNEVSLSTSSKNKYLTVGRVFCNRLNVLRLFPFDFESPKSFKITKSHKRQPLTKDHIRKILDFVQDDSVMNTMIHLLYFQGLRGNEVRSIQVEHINLGNGSMMVSGKGRDGDLESIRLHPRTVSTLKNYLKETEISSGPLFQGRFPNQPISQSKFWTSINKVFTSLGMESNPHSFRKSFVSSLIENPDLDLITISKFSRHKTINTLQVYYDRVSLEKSFPTVVESLEV